MDEKFIGVISKDYDLDHFKKGGEVERITTDYIRGYKGRYLVPVTNSVTQWMAIKAVEFQRPLDLFLPAPAHLLQAHWDTYRSNPLRYLLWNARRIKIGADVPTPSALEFCGKWVVDCATELVAVLDFKGDSVAYEHLKEARRQGKPVHVIDVEDL